jgi:hypothetical protein
LTPKSLINLCRHRESTNSSMASDAVNRFAFYSQETADQPWLRSIPCPSILREIVVTLADFAKQISLGRSDKGGYPPSKIYNIIRHPHVGTFIVRCAFQDLAPLQPGVPHWVLRELWCTSSWRTRNRNFLRRYRRLTRARDFRVSNRGAPRDSCDSIQPPRGTILHVSRLPFAVIGLGDDTVKEFSTAHAFHDQIIGRGSVKKS